MNPDDHLQSSTTTIFLIRHAEPYFPPYKENPPDPHLNFAGRQRALQFANFLRDVAVDGIYSTDFLRSKETVEPLAKQKNISIQTYNRKNLAAFARELLKKSGVYVISGHSTTTPELASLLGGKRGSPINNNSEFDKIYMLIISGKTVKTYILRYGLRYE